MDENRSLELFKNELDSITMPDLWEKVYNRVQNIQSVRKKSGQRYRKRSRIYAFIAAGAAAFCAAVSLVIFLSVRNMPVDIKNNTEQPVSQSNVINDIPIRSVQPYSFSLSERAKEELEEKLGSFSRNDIIYEDSTYIYRFDTKGVLCDMIETENGNRLDLKKTARTLIQNHFSGVSADNYAITIDDSGEYPMLCATAVISQNGLMISEISMRFYTDEWQKLLDLE